MKHLIQHLSPQMWHNSEKKELKHRFRQLLKLERSITDLEDKNHTNAILIKPDGAGTFAYETAIDSIGPIRH